MTGAEYIIRFLEAVEVPYLFGNPGTTELPLNDAAVDSCVQYILALHEIPAVAMADGYAQASGKMGVVNLHISCGVGNAMGMLYNAYRAGSPLVVTAGQQDQRFIHTDPILWGDMVTVTRPWTKWSAEVRTLNALPSLLRRAFQIALSPPTGPVFLSLPLDIQMAVMPDVPAPTSLTLPHRAAVPDPNILEAAARVLAESESPAILLGSKPLGAAGKMALVHLAELLGAPVFHEPYYAHGRCNFPPQHPLAAGLLPFWTPEIRAGLETFDLVLAIGVKLFEEYIYHGDIAAIPERTQLIHVDDDDREIGKNYPPTLGLLGNIEAIVQALDFAISKFMKGDRPTVRARRQRWQKEIATARAQLRQRAQHEKTNRPLPPLAMLEALASILPPEVAVVEEAPTTSGSYFERAGVLPTAEGFFAHKGWALGWGLGCALGVRLAWPDRPVLALLGDGAALYGIQGLWTAAHYRIPVTIVVANNHQYGILKSCALVLGLPRAAHGRFCGLDLDRPAIDFVLLATSFGVDAFRVETCDELRDAAITALSSDRPVLIEVPVAPAPLETA